MPDLAPVPLLLPNSALPWYRRVGVLVSVGALLVMWGNEIVGGHQLDKQALLVFISLALSMVLVNLNHSGAQIVARGLWWPQLVLGTVASILSGDQQRDSFVFSFGAGGALLMAGAAGLKADGSVRGTFAPAAFRRPLLISIAMSVAEVQALSVASSSLLSSSGHQRALGAQLGACALLLACALVGLYRLRFWGVLLHLLATLMLAFFGLRAVQGSSAGGVAAYVWFAGVIVQLIVPLPMLAAIVRRTPVAPSSPSSLAPRLFFGVVVALMALSAVKTLGVHF